ncbi:hypothetical protein IGI04_024733, partial [Brassica rapa subsp. trilocularis]
IGFNLATRLLRVTPSDTGSRQVSHSHWRRGVDVTRWKAERESFLSFSRKKLGFSPPAISRATPISLHFSLLFSIDSTADFLLHFVFQMDPLEEIRDNKRQLEFLNHLGDVADSEYGMPRRCACGGRMIDELRVKDEFDTQPGKRFFSCVNYEADGLHYRQPWVIGVQEEMVRLRKRVEEADEVIKGVPILNKQIESVEAQVKRLTLLLDKLTGDVYNLTVQVAALE